MPGGRIRSFNDWGDYSYGVYIYAFPIQQTLAYLFPAMSLGAMMASSALVSVAIAFFAIAVVSWKLIEERALAMKGEFAAATHPRVPPGPHQDRSRRALTAGASALIGRNAGKMNVKASQVATSGQNPKWLIGERVEFGMSGRRRL